jgi:hypothetical protein
MVPRDREQKRDEDGERDHEDHLVLVAVGGREDQPGRTGEAREDQRADRPQHAEELVEADEPESYEREGEDRPAEVDDDDREHRPRDRNHDPCCG